MKHRTFFLRIEITLTCTSLLRLRKTLSPDKLMIQIIAMVKRIELCRS